MKAFGNAYKNATPSIGGGDFRKLPAGGYIVEITGVKDEPNKEYLQVIYDIAEGEFKGYYADDWGKDHPYAHCMYKSYKTSGKSPEEADKVWGRFRGFIQCIDKSNGTNFDMLYQGSEPVNEQLLKGKRLGLIIGYEEYKTDRGEVRERTYVVANRSIDGLQEWLGKVAKGEAKLPELKKLKEEVAPASPYPEFVGLKDSDIPF